MTKFLKCWARILGIWLVIVTAIAAFMFLLLGWMLFIPWLGWWGVVPWFLIATLGIAVMVAADNG